MEKYKNSKNMIQGIVGAFLASFWIMAMIFGWIIAFEGIFFLGLFAFLIYSAYMGFMNYFFIRRMKGKNERPKI